MLISLAEYALRTRQEYNRALRRAIRGSIPGAERLSGRWYIPESSLPAATATDASAPRSDTGRVPAKRSKAPPAVTP